MFSKGKFKITNKNFNKPKVKYPCVILAGGKSSRMNNVNKAFVLIKDHTLISIIIKKISKNNLPIAINANEHLDKFSKFGLEIIKDQFVGHLGPLSGIYSALNWANSLNYEWVFTFPCDVPFFPNDIFLKANNLLDDKAKNFDLISVTSNLKKHHIISLWNIKLIEDLQIKMTSGLRKVDQFTSNLNIEYIHYNFNNSEIDPFFNINSENEIKKLDNYKKNFIF